MASLNSLRTKGGIFLSVIIAVALIAFLLGDFTSAGNQMLSSKKMRVGEIGNKNIGYVEFLNESEYTSNVLQTLYGKSSLTSEETDQAREMTWQNLIMRYAFLPAMDKMGVKVSDGEQIDMTSGTYLSPVITSTFVDPSTGQYNQELLNNFIANMGLDNTGNAAMIWEYLKTNMINQRLMDKFVTLVSGGVFVNDLEIEQGLAAANNVYGAQYVFKSYESIPDSTVNVSDSEIRKYYDEHKKIFKQTAQRDIEYVLFDLLPSDEDYAEAQKHIDEVAAEFEESATPMQYATLNSQDNPDQRYYKESELDTKLAAIAFGEDKGKMYGPVLSNDTYTVSRLADIKQLPDSIGAKHILLPAGSKEKADSIVGVLKNGGDFAALAAEFSIDQSAAQNGGDLGIFPPEYMIPAFSEACIAARKGDIFTVETQYGIHVVELTYKSPMVAKAQIATITYRVDPSSTTQQKVYSEVSEFVTKLGGKAENFTAAANESGLVKRIATIRNTDRSLQGVDDSREVVRWAFNNKVNTISPITEVGGDYIVAVLKSAREDGITPVGQVASLIRNYLIQEKKGEMLAGQMKGATIEEVAAAAGSEIKEVSDVKFGSFYLDGVPTIEPKLIGAICAAPKDVVSKPVTGNAGVYVFVKTSAETVEDATVESEKVRLEAMAESFIGERIQQALTEQSEVKDMRVKFF